MLTVISAVAPTPLPILFLNGYGDNVFKNVPVVVNTFNVELRSGIDYISTQASYDFDPGNGFTNFGILTEGNSNFPQHVHGAGVQGTMLSNSFDMGGIAVASVDTIDWGSIA